MEKPVQHYAGKTIAVYGLSAETKRFLTEHGAELSVVALLDGFRESGEMYGLPIIPLAEAIRSGVEAIVIVARPGSRKAIVRRIGETCRNAGVSLVDVDGRDLLAVGQTESHFLTVHAGTRQKLLTAIREADAVSFDLFDTLIMRQVLCHSDLFELLEAKLKADGIYVPDLAKVRLEAEMELSRAGSPTLEEIWASVLRMTGGTFLSARELAELEWELDVSTLVPREAMCEIFRDTVRQGKSVYIVTDSYYSNDQIQKLLTKFGLDGCAGVFVSSAVGVGKSEGLFDTLRERAGAARLLHVGDDETTDISAARRQGITAFRVFSGADLLEVLGGPELERSARNAADRLKLGLFASLLLRDPFCFETWSDRISVADSYALGYLFFAPLISDFVFWLRRRLREEGFSQILFSARDGYLLGRLFREIEPEIEARYFLTSRASAVRAGIFDAVDLAYVDSMNYFGTLDENTSARFGIRDAGSGKNRERAILQKAERERDNYRVYVEKLGLSDGNTAFFDFVAKGTVQLFLSNVLSQRLKGFYFLRLEPDALSDRGIDIEAFYSDQERNGSAIMEDYYLFEIVLSSPFPSCVAFAETGRPVFDTETRSPVQIQSMLLAQKGIEDYFSDFVRLLPDTLWIENRDLDERILMLLHHTRLEDTAFLSSKVEDPFVGRNTFVSDLL